MSAIYSAISLMFAGSRLNRLIESSKVLQSIALAKQKDADLLQSCSLTLSSLAVLRMHLSEPLLVKLQHFARVEGMHHISSMFGSGHEPNPSVVEKDPFGILLVGKLGAALPCPFRLPIFHEAHEAHNPPRPNQ